MYLGCLVKEHNLLCPFYVLIQMLFYPLFSIFHTTEENYSHLKKRVLNGNQLLCRIKGVLLLTKEQLLEQVIFYTLRFRQIIFHLR